MRRVLLFVLVGLLCLALCSCDSIGSQLNQDEQQAYECAIKMKNMLKNPDSFKLYDTMLVLKQYDDDGSLLASYIMFKYGGTNSYGAVVTGEAVFKDGEYLMDYADEPDPDAPNATAQYFFKMAISFYELEQMGEVSNPTYELLELDVGKIKNKLGME